MVDTPCVCKFTIERLLSALFTTAAKCKISSTPTLVGAFPTDKVTGAEPVSRFNKDTAPPLPPPSSTTTATPSAESMPTAMGCVPTAMGAFAEVGTFEAEGEIATFTEDINGDPLGTSVFCTTTGISPGVANEKLGLDSVTCSWRLLVSEEGSVAPSELTCVEDEK